MFERADLGWNELRCGPNVETRHSDPITHPTTNASAQGHTVILFRDDWRFNVLPRVFLTVSKCVFAHPGGVKRDESAQTLLKTSCVKLRGILEYL